MRKNEWDIRREATEAAESQLAASVAEVARLREALSTVSGMRTGNGDPWGLIDAMRNCADAALAPSTRFTSGI